MHKCETAKFVQSLDASSSYLHEACTHLFEYDLGSTDVFDVSEKVRHARSEVHQIAVHWNRCLKPEECCNESFTFH